MKVPLPLIISLIAAVMLYFNFGFYVLLIPFFEIMIDFDGMLYYMLKNKKYNLVKVFKSKEYKNQPIRFAHNIEFLILLFLCSFLSYTIFVPIVIGTIIHYAFDITSKNYKSRHGWFISSLLVKKHL